MIYIYAYIHAPPKTSLASPTSLMLFLHQSEDVLSIIFNLCSKSSLLSLFTTSSHLHSLLAPFILRDIHLTRDQHQITSFLHYIITHRRLPFIGSHVKSLNIAYTAIVPVSATLEEGEEQESNSQNPTWASLLSPALSLMPNLRALILGYQVDKIFASYPDIPDRILRLKYLSCIQLSDIDTAAADMLDPRSLRNIKIVLKRHMKLVPVSSENGVGKILIQNRNTLSKLSIANPDFSAANFLDSPRAIFPNVTTLSLTSYTASPLELSRSFPNVRVLTLTGSSTFLSPPTTPNSPPGENQDEILFPHVSSLHSDEPDLRALLSPPFIPTPTPSLSLSNLRHLSLNSISLTKYSSSWFLKGADLSGLQSFKFCIWNAAPSESWWREFVHCVPNLEFLDATIRVDVTFRDLVLIVRRPSSSSFFFFRIYNFFHRISNSPNFYHPSL